MPATRLTVLAAGALMLLQACTSAGPVDDATASSEQQPVPELNLNLPEEDVNGSAYVVVAEVDTTFLDKGFAELAAGDHREAMNYFRRYQRLESSPAVDWEAGIAVAFDKMMPTSPYYNSKAASESYRQLMRDQPRGIPLHETILLMRDALAVLVALHAQIDDLRNENGLLSENLEKREEALKRLRELTLGQ